MRILITSYFFHPEGTPRATRTFELAREFARRGHEVVVHVPDYPVDYAELEKRYGFRVRKAPSGHFLNIGDKRADSPASRVLAKPAPIKRALYRAYHWATGGRHAEYARTLARALVSEGETYDLVVSIGLPFSVHRGTARYLRKFPAAAAVADYGDPYYYDPMERKLFLQRFIEAGTLAAFDRITIPHDRILDCFTPYRQAAGKVRIVPQGFDLESVERSAYRPNPKPTFGYAGVFYKSHGNPSELLEALCRRADDFRFIVYTDARAGSESMGCLAPYAGRLGERLEVRARVARPEVIRAMSAMDFLVSIDWPGVLHTKLIDYKLAGRPILSYEPGRFDEAALMAFMAGRYDADFSPGIDLSAYDIRRVAERFIAMAEGRE